MYLEHYSIISGIKSFSLVSCVKKEYQQAYVSSTEPFSFRSKFLFFPPAHEETLRRTGFYGHSIWRKLWPRGHLHPALVLPLEICSRSVGGSQPQDLALGEVTGWKEKELRGSCLLGPQKEEDLWLKLWFVELTREKRIPRHSTTKDTAHELLIVAFHHSVSAPLGFSLTYARTCSNDIPPNPLPLMWFILNREFQLQ